MLKAAVIVLDCGCLFLLRFWSWSHEIALTVKVTSRNLPIALTDSGSFVDFCSLSDLPAFQFLISFPFYKGSYIASALKFPIFFQRSNRVKQPRRSSQVMRDRVI